MKEIGKMKVYEYLSKFKVEEEIEFCEGKHTQQVVYSSYHRRLTQICFDCMKVRYNK